MSTRITLKYPFKGATGEMKSINLRRPKVRDLKEVQKLGLSDAEQELMLLARLTEEKLTPEDLEELDLADYAELQRQFQDMVGATGRPVDVRGATREMVPFSAV
jgi:hypothetical protein